MHESLCRWADQAAGDFLLLNPKDLSELAKFMRQLEEQADACAANSDFEAGPAIAARLKQAAARLKAVILEEESDAAAVMSQVGAALEAAQAAGRGDPLPDAGATAPPASPGPDAAPEESAPETAGSEAADWVDDSIMAAYVEQQASVLPEMEQRALEFEKNRDTGPLSDLRRMIHTLKGESGVVGALHVESVCHRLEDYLDSTPEAVTADILLEALDWIGKAVQSFGQGVREDSDALLEHLSPTTPGEATTEPNAQEEAAEAEAPEEKESFPADIETIPIGDGELAGDFVAEAQEHFDVADENLLVLEQEPENADSIAAVFRAFHTIKGVAGFLGMAPMGDLAHVAETLLDEIRKGKRTFAGAAVDATFGALDHLKVMVSDLRDALAEGREFPVRPERFQCMAAIRAILDSSAPDLPAPPPPETPKAELPEKSTPPPAAASEPPPATGASAGPARTTAATMKVEAARIDLLLDTIGELVIAESIVSGDPEIRSLKSLRVEKSLALLGKITRSLQDMGMSMRLVPIDPVFRKMARLVRDLSRKSGKDVKLEIQGGETEIDKSLVEKLGDPLVHMIRNSMDHGIESAKEREAAGKPAAGSICLRAYHKGGSIHIDIEDDGRGLDREAILSKAIERGLISSGDNMPDADIFALIFESGFSTAKQITEISGRGVGMDVVRRNIEALRGNVQIRSTPGRGSVFTLVLPLTTAIIDGMLARVGEETFILPTLSVLESFRPEPGQVQTVTGRGEMVSFRSALLPLFRLSRMLHVAGAEEDPQKAIVMVVEEKGKPWGILADELLGQQQIVIKSIGEGLGSVQGIAGASILADGRPGLILDASGLIRLATGQ